MLFGTTHLNPPIPEKLHLKSFGFICHMYLNNIKGGGSAIPPKKEDPFLQRILCLISTSAVVLFNPYDCDTMIPAVQNQTAISAVETEDFAESPPAEYKDILLSPSVVIVDDHVSEARVKTTQPNNKDVVTKLIIDIYINCFNKT
ncbi:uncharacterized protein LOC125058398 [Pieris napi]|uniref:uncharacterized protein LOC125058398 n=1 Tax=Pieris napi TaxID=78633 RepID=UPI001FBAC5A4|nr:uncharacterized protein LOC125058398 [Pieris napi]